MCSVLGLVFQAYSEFGFQRIYLFHMRIPLYLMEKRTELSVKHREL